MTAQSLYARIALVFAGIVLALGGGLSWLGYDAAKQHQHEVLQRVNLGLAQHIAKQASLVADPLSTQRLFDHLMAVNPNIEVYLLDPQGKVLQVSPQPISLPRSQVSLEPVRRLIAGAALPVTGDNPRHAEGREIFSAAPIETGDGVTGYVYIVLLNDMYRAMVAEAWQGYALRSGAKVAMLAVIVAIIAGLAAFAALTRRLERTIREVEAFASVPNEAALSVSTASKQHRGDEIERLRAAFASLRERLNVQMAELKRQDELRRELVANVSHDLRTPLTSMQGYLEALARMDDGIDDAERKRYLDVAVRQSHRVSRLAQQLFELARLECEETQPQTELFSVSELVHDIAQKFNLVARRKSIRLNTEVDEGPLSVLGDIGMIERVIGNLVDNAIRHTPEGGDIYLVAHVRARGIEVRIDDTGQGISEEQLPGLLIRGSPIRRMATQRGGGLGLLIANRILHLHGSTIQAASRVGEGTSISFILPVAKAA
ncbi:MAG: ATP-binding protein [Lysobacteraceae bacterium]